MKVKKDGQFYEVETQGYTFTAYSDQKGTRLVSIPHLYLPVTLESVEIYIKALEDVKEAIIGISKKMYENQ